jgi:hypothetical protein
MDIADQTETYIPDTDSAVSLKAILYYKQFSSNSEVNYMF